MDKVRWWSANIKSFLRPDLAKVITTVILISLSTISYHAYPRITSVTDAPSIADMGFPMRFVRVEAGLSPIMGASFIWLGLVIDLTVYYLISCIVMWDFYTIRSKLSKTSK